MSNPYQAPLGDPENVEPPRRRFGPMGCFALGFLAFLLAGCLLSLLGFSPTPVQQPLPTPAAQPQATPPPAPAP